MNWILIRLYNSKYSTFPFASPNILSCKFSYIFILSCFFYFHSISLAKILSFNFWHCFQNYLRHRPVYIIFPSTTLHWILVLEKIILNSWILVISKSFHNLPHPSPFCLIPSLLCLSYVYQTSRIPNLTTVYFLHSFPSCYYSQLYRCFLPFFPFEKLLQGPS